MCSWGLLRELDLGSNYPGLNLGCLANGYSNRSDVASAHRSTNPKICCIATVSASVVLGGSAMADSILTRAFASEIAHTL